jgi:hypothetical protein
MSTSHAYSRFRMPPPGSRPAPRPAAPEPSAKTTTLTERLDTKLKELNRLGYRIRWIEMSSKELVTLFEEGGEDAVRLDADPDVDKAWYGDIEVRATEKALIWIWLDGEVPGETSAHVID